MNSYVFSLLFLVSVFYFVNGCRTSNEYFPNGGGKAFAVMKGVVNDSRIAGTILFEQDNIDAPVRISVNISGIPKGLGPKHGLHVHQTTITSTSDSTADICGSSGLHFNPLNKTHGNISADIRHIGDYGNVVSAQGSIVYNFIDSISKLYGVYGIIGRTIVLHQLEDDLGLNKNSSASLITGNAGGRIACGIIGIL